MSTLKNVDIVRLGLGHSLILGNIPGIVGVQGLCNIRKAEAPKSELASFGLFESSSPNYTTYYPDATPDQFVAAEDEFIKPIFRGLSEVIVHKKYNPIDFAKNGLLRPSQKLLLGQTINVDHEVSLGNALGAISDVAWEESYKVDDIIIPAGINTELKIDAKANTRIARLITMKPPGVHSTSVTVEFQWEQSHPKMDRGEFFAKLATFDDKGELIRRVVTKIVRYHEISLVSHGADPFAQLVTDGKINNPNYANITYNSDKEKQYVGSVYFIDFKKWGQEDAGDITSNSANKTIPQTNNNINNDNMNRELFISLCAILGLGIQLEDGENPTAEHETQLRERVTQANTDAEGLAAANTRIQDLEAEVTTLTAQAPPDVAGLTQQITTLSTFRNSVETSLRDKVMNAYKLSAGDNINQTVIDSITNSNYEALTGMVVTYEAQLNEKMPLKCTSCGSNEVSRGTAKLNEPDAGVGAVPGVDKGALSVNDSLLSKKSQSASLSIHKP